jgi:glyoxylase-like metal-dependent hydrolase (beta-lactamase superfamily II)
MSGMEVVDGVHRIEAEVGGRPLYLFLFLGEHRLLLDAGCASTVGEFIVPYLTELGLGIESLDILVISHSDLDHQGGAHALKRENPSLLVTCGALDAPLVSDPERLVAQRYEAYRADHGIGYDSDTLAWMREASGPAQAVDIGWVGGEPLWLSPDWELRFVHVPGHSPGHVALSDRRSRALFSGDCLQGSVYRGLDGTPLLCPTYTHVDPYLETAATVESLAPSELHGCHWPTQRGDDVRAFVAETRAYVERIDGLVVASLGDRPLTLRSMIARVNEQLDQPWPEHLEQELVYSIHGHIERLVEGGDATAERDKEGRVVYRSSA